MADMKFYSFREIYRDWYYKKHPEEGVSETDPVLPNEKELRGEFESLLLRMGVPWDRLKVNDTFQFNEAGKEFVIHFLENYAEPCYKKRIRRGLFSSDDVSRYDNILAIILSNMEDIGYTQKDIDRQAIGFWHTVTEGVSNREEFLTGLLKIYSLDELRERLPKSYIALEDIYFLNERIKEDFARFQAEWRERVEMVLEGRQLECEKILSYLAEASDLAKSVNQALDSLQEYLLAYPDVPKRGHRIQDNKGLRKDEKTLQKRIGDDFDPIAIYRSIKEQFPLEVAIQLYVSDSRELYEEVKRLEEDDTQEEEGQ